MLGRGHDPSWVAPHDQVLRNQNVGSRCSVSALGPRLATPIRISISLGEDLAYSTVTSKYRLSAKTPVSSSSNSGSSRLRRWFSSTRRAYGNSLCGYL